MNELSRGAGCLLEGFRLIRVPGLRRFVLIPLLINMVLFASLIWLAADWFSGLMAWALGYLPEWLQWLSYLMWPIFALAALLTIVYGFTIIANLIGAPFNGLLAEAVEAHLTGRSLDSVGGLGAALRDVIPSLWSELRKLGYMVMWFIPLGIAFLIPGINLFAPFLWALFSAWMLAVEYADYPMGNHAMRFVQQRALLRRKRFLSLGFGGAVLGMTMVPFLNFFAMPSAVAGSTALWVRHLSAHRDNL